MSLREQITAAALLGGNTFTAEGSPLDRLLPAISGREPAQRTLDAIALVTVYEEAGALALAAPERLPAPCDPDPRPRCGTLAAGHLSELLADPRGILDEWLGIANQAGLRPPEESIPALLDAASRDRSLRAAAATAAGPLGVWLSRFREEWSWIRESADSGVIWETGTLAERLAVLRRIRESDPGRGRELLEAAWRSESADARRQFLETLATGLGPGDEAFLESCLDDRAATVRRAAAELLGSMPGSALGRRMRERLAGRVRLRHTGLLSRKPVIEVTPFESVDAAMIRDGIDGKPPVGTTLGERAWWTALAMAAVPPSHWTTLLGAPPAQLIAGAGNGEWADLLIEGWQAAAIRYRDAEWLGVLATDPAVPIAKVLEVYRVLSPGERERCLIRLHRGESGSWILNVPTFCPHPWSESFTREITKLAVKTPGAIPHRAFASLAATGTYPPPPEEAFGEFAGLYQYRRAMREALRKQENE